MKKSIPIDIYGYKLYVLTDEEKGTYNVSDDFDVELSDENDYEGITFFNGDEVCVHLIKKSFEIIGHEAIHVANYIFKNCGIKYDYDNDEPFAYLVGYIIENIIKSIDLE